MTDAEHEAFKELIRHWRNQAAAKRAAAFHDVEQRVRAEQLDGCAEQLTALAIALRGKP